MMNAGAAAHEQAGRGGSDGGEQGSSSPLDGDPASASSDPIWHSVGPHAASRQATTNANHYGLESQGLLRPAVPPQQSGFPRPSSMSLLPPAPLPHPPRAASV